MPRWIQNPEPPYNLIPADEAAARRDGLQVINRDFDAFVSPVDGSLIRTHRDLENHNKRNGVVDSREFSKEFLQEKARERAKFFTGDLSTREKFQRRQEIYERWLALERAHG